METWRPDPFRPGQHYRVRKDFKAFRDDFKKGEVIVYQKNAYSIHESMSGFFFLDSSQKWRSWDVSDGESTGDWTELFELIS